MRNGPKVALSRVDTYPGGVWHGRFTVPQLAYGDGKVYAYNGNIRRAVVHLRQVDGASEDVDVERPNNARVSSTAGRAAVVDGPDGHLGDAAPELPPVPDGFRCRTVADGDVPQRVSIHREVWAPSRLTESSYAQVRAEWPYRDSLDCVVEAPDGRFAAYCLCWPDDLNSVAEFEPVGTREEFRRRGLGAAVCTFALRRLHDEGIRQAIVYCSSPPACALYESLGFRIHASLVGYSRPGTTT